MAIGPDQFEQTRDPLPALRKQLALEFQGVYTPERIDEAAEQALSEFREARVRAFLPILAGRRARQLLRHVS